MAAREKAQRERQEVIREGKRQVIGFYHAPKRGKHKDERAVALYPETAFTVVQKSLGLRGERFQYRAGDVWAQMADEGYLVRIELGKRARQRSAYKVRVNTPNGGRLQTLLVRPDLLLAHGHGEEDEDGPEWSDVTPNGPNSGPQPDDEEWYSANEYQQDAHNGDQEWYSANEYQQDAHTVPDKAAVPSRGASGPQNTLPPHPAWEPKTTDDFFKVIEHCLMLYGVTCSYEDYFDYSTRQGYMKLTEAKYYEYRSILA